MLGLFSCQPAIKLFLRVKDPSKHRYVNNKDRLEYYQPFLEKTPQYYSFLNLYTITDTSTIQKFMKQHPSYPMIIVQDRKTDSLYRISCFEDVEWDVEHLDKRKSLTSLYRAKRENYTDVQKLLKENVSLWRQEEQNVIQDSIKNWNVYMVSGIFLGKKIRKMTLPIMELKNVNEFNIIDLSVNKE